MSDPLSIGIVGAGSFASRRHLPDLKARSDVIVAAVCRRNPDQLAVFADHFDVPERYTDYEAMLEGARLDAMVVATPHALHHVQAKMALERGLHVLLEKPMALKASEAEELLDLAAAKERVLTVGLNPPFWAHTQVVRAALQGGEIGNLEAVSVHWIGNTEAVFGRVPMPEEMPGVVKPTLYRSDPDLSGGGIMVDVGSHLISELTFVTGLEVQAVSAQMDDTVSDLQASVQMRLSGGVPAEILNLGNSHHPDRRIQNIYFGSEGRIQIGGMPFLVTLDRVGADPVTISEIDMPDVSGPVDTFVDAVRGEREDSTAAHGVEVVRVMEAVYRSAREGRRVDL